MKIAIITGASSGIGLALVYEIDRCSSDIDEVWVISRKRTAIKVHETKWKIKKIEIDLTTVSWIFCRSIKVNVCEY